MDFTTVRDEVPRMRAPVHFRALAVAAMLAASPLAAQATAFVPDLDPAYRDLEALVAAGWVRTTVPGARPVSRLAMARFAAEARAHVGSAAHEPARFVEALARLEREFGAEPSAPPRPALRGATADGTLADSPYRAIPTSYESPGASYVDADLNPLLQKNLGRELADGATLGVEALADARLGSRFVAQARPRGWVDAARGDGAGGGVTLLEGYVRGLFGNLSVEAGRNHVAQGHGPDAGPMLSHNARGLDLVRLSLERPWVLGALGRMDASILMADLGSNRQQPRSKLVVGHARWSVARWVEVGVFMLNQQGGKGAPEATFAERLQDIFLFWAAVDDRQFSDKVIGGDLRLAIPSARAELWVQAMTTDDHGRFRHPDQALATEAVWIAGLKKTGIGPEARFDVWAEGRRAGVRPHTHHQLRSGEALDRRVIGDALGPLARGLSAGVDWRGVEHTVAVEAALEDYSGADVYRDSQADGYLKWVRQVDNPDEIRARVVADWSVDATPGRFAPAVRLGWERVTRFAFGDDARSNLLAQVRFDYRP